MSIRDEKELVRQAILAKRNGVSRKEIIKKSSEIKELLFQTQEFQNASLIMFYASFGSEVETYQMAEEALSYGKKVCFPFVIKKEKRLNVAAVGSLDELKKGTYDILEPNKAHVVSLSSLDLVVVPGVAFDIEGYRLGYGGGYYDKFLSKLNKDTVTIGLAFELQMVEILPHEKFDIGLDKIITPERIIDAGLAPA